MNRLANVADGFSGREEALCWLAGLGFTGLLFVGLAYFEDVHPTQPAAELMDLRAVSLPFEPPPPAPHPDDPPPPPQENLVALSGIEIGASDSPVHIAVVPPDLEGLVPATRELPGAIARFGYLDTNLKPRLVVDTDVRHVYQVSEVDRPPHAIVRVAPPGAGRFFGTVRSLRVDVLLVIDMTGHGEGAHVVQSSGNPEFDRLVAQTVQDQWVFEPAIRRGKKVKCMAMQLVRVTVDGGSMFEVR